MSQPTSIPGPESITRRVLDNGIVVLVRENHTSPSVSIHGYLRAGSVDESNEQAGLAAFTADCLERGTGRRTFTQIAEAIEAVGATLHVGSGLHTTRFSAKSLAEDIDLVLGILADLLQDPTFPQGEIEKVRGEILTDLEERENDTQRMADLTFRALAYPSGHPYGRSGEGYKETIQALSRDDLVNFYRRYRPQGMAVAVVGAIDTGSAIERIEKMLGGWHNDVVKPPAMELPPLPKLTEARRQVVTIPGKTQFDIVLGAPAIARTDPDFMPTLLANTVFGVFGMMGRLGKNVRDEQGLAYYVYSRLEVSVWPGPWVAAAGVNPANVDRALDSILAEMRRMRETIVPKDELADSQSYLTGSMPLRLETNEGVASALLDIEFYDLGLDYLQRYPELVQAVMPEQVQAVAQKYLQPDTYALAIAGPEEGSGA